MPASDCLRYWSADSHDRKCVDWRTKLSALRFVRHKPLASVRAGGPKSGRSSLSTSFPERRHRRCRNPRCIFDVGFKQILRHARSHAPYLTSKLNVASSECSAPVGNNRLWIISISCAVHSPNKRSLTAWACAASFSASCWFKNLTRPSVT